MTVEHGYRLAGHSFSFLEHWQGRTGTHLGIKEILYQEQSPYQHILVCDSDFFGKTLILDSAINVTEFDEFVYHEMLAHPAMFSLGGAEHILIIGGGDGGAAREVLKHKSVEHVDLVDIDDKVVEAAKRFFPNCAKAFDDPRLQLHIADGVAFAKNALASHYDLIIIDSTDPIGAGSGLFTKAFYRDCERILRAQGMIAVQSESPFDRPNEHILADIRSFFGEFFPIVESYLAFIPSYPTGMFSFTIASKLRHPLHNFEENAECNSISKGCRYYNAEIHRAAFALPNFVRQGLK